MLVLIVEVSLVPAWGAAGPLVHRSFPLQFPSVSLPAHLPIWSAILLCSFFPEDLAVHVSCLCCVSGSSLSWAVSPPLLLASARIPTLVQPSLRLILLAPLSPPSPPHLLLFLLPAMLACLPGVLTDSVLSPISEPSSPPHRVPRTPCCTSARRMMTPIIPSLQPHRLLFSHLPLPSARSALASAAATF